MKWLLLTAGLAAAKLDISRSIESDTFSGSLVVDHGCSSSDEWGSNKCSFDFKDKLTLAYNVDTTAEIGEGYTISAKLKVDKLISFDVDCKACGSTCDVVVPIIKQKYTLQFPPCPLLAAGASLNGTVSLKIPKYPGIEVSAAGPVSLKNPSGHTVASIDLDVAMQSDSKHRLRGGGIFDII
mmetsp:Transcript_27143/g.91236  ORF Transcript_27143/g.91236 Transcript_27143/m.91236 type:complete len:182 (+) Transcript_27143:152-697(+)